MKSVDRVGRPTCTDQCTFGRHGTVDRQGRPGLRAELSVCLGRPGGRPVAGNGQNLTVGRLTGRSTGSVFLAQRLNFSGVYKYPICESFSLSLAWLCAHHLLIALECIALSF